VSDELYQEHILDHFESPYHKGDLENPTCKHRDKNPICGDEVELAIKIDETGKVREAWFQGHGCAISQAAASMLVEEIEGKTIEELREFEAQEMLDLLKVQLTATRQKCGLLGFKVLKTMIYSIDGTPVTEEVPSA